MVLTSDSKHARLLQLADVVTSCTLSLIAGEERFAPDTFRHIEPLLRREAGRVGGVGVKIHPDLRYCNLYHWLFGDSHIWRNGVGHPLPLRGQMYYASATDPNLM